MTDYEKLVNDLLTADNLTADHRILSLTDRAASAIDELTKPKHTDYTELIHDLRYCADRNRPDCSICGYEANRNACNDRIKLDAAAAIEALQAEVERLQADVDAAYAH